MVTTILFIFDFAKFCQVEGNFHFQISPSRSSTNLSIRSFTLPAALTIRKSLHEPHTDEHSYEYAEAKELSVYASVLHRTSVFCTLWQQKCKQSIWWTGSSIFYVSKAFSGLPYVADFILSPTNTENSRTILGKLTLYSQLA